MTESEDDSDGETAPKLSLQTQIDQLVAVLKHKDAQLKDKEKLLAQRDQTIESMNHQLSKQKTVNTTNCNMIESTNTVPTAVATTDGAAYSLEDLAEYVRELEEECDALRMQNESNENIIKIILKSQAEQLRYFENLKKHKQLYPVQYKMCMKMMEETKNGMDAMDSMDAMQSVDDDKDHDQDPLKQNAPQNVPKNREETAIAASMEMEMDSGDNDLKKKETEDGLCDNSKNREEATSMDSGDGNLKENETECNPKTASLETKCGDGTSREKEEDDESDPRLSDHDKTTSSRSSESAPPSNRKDDDSDPTDREDTDPLEDREETASSDSCWQSLFNDS